MLRMRYTVKGQFLSQITKKNETDCNFKFRQYFIFFFLLLSKIVMYKNEPRLSTNEIDKGDNQSAHPR